MIRAVFLLWVMGFMTMDMEYRHKFMRLKEEKSPMKTCSNISCRLRKEHNAADKGNRQILSISV